MILSYLHFVHIIDIHFRLIIQTLLPIPLEKNSSVFGITEVTNSNAILYQKVNSLKENIARASPTSITAARSISSRGVWIRQFGGSSPRDLDIGPKPKSTACARFNPVILSPFRYTRTPSTPGNR